MKHLRSILNKARISTATCKDKRDLAELVLKNRARFQLKVNNHAPSQRNNSTSGTTSSSTRSAGQHRSSSSSTSNHQQQPQQQNNMFSNIMHNVQDFVNFNLNSVLNNSVPCPPPSHTNPNATSSSNNSSSSQNSTNNTGTFNRSSSTSSNASSSIPQNLNSVFNLIGDLPNIINPAMNAFTETEPPPQSRNQQQPPQPTSSQQPEPFATSSSTNRENQRNAAASNSHTNAASPHQSTASTTASSTLNTDANVNSSTGSAQGTSRVKRRASLSDLKSESDIDNLSIKQIKEILASNFVEYKGCCERKELVDKLVRLYHSDKENKRLEQELSNQAASGATTSSSSGVTPASVIESEICKICMEAVIDCVLLDCGHMCSCIKCGKQCAECPICRQNVVRVVRVFKS